MASRVLGLFCFALLLCAVKGEDAEAAQHTGQDVKDIKHYSPHHDTQKDDTHLAASENKKPGFNTSIPSARVATSTGNDALAESGSIFRPIVLYNLHPLPVYISLYQKYSSRIVFPLSHQLLGFDRRGMATLSAGSRFVLYGLLATRAAEPPYAGYVSLSLKPFIPPSSALRGNSLQTNSPVKASVIDELLRVHQEMLQTDAPKYSNPFNDGGEDVDPSQQVGNITTVSEAASDKVTDKLREIKDSYSEVAEKLSPEAQEFLRNFEPTSADNTEINPKVGTGEFSLNFHVDKEEKLLSYNVVASLPSGNILYSWRFAEGPNCPPAARSVSDKEILKRECLEVAICAKLGLPKGDTTCFDAPQGKLELMNPPTAA